MWACHKWQSQIGCSVTFSGIVVCFRYIIVNTLHKDDDGDDDDDDDNNNNNNNNNNSVLNLLPNLSVNRALNLGTNMSGTVMDASLGLDDIIGDVTSVCHHTTSKNCTFTYLYPISRRS